MRELLTSGEAARLLGISARTVRRYLAEGRITAEQNPITGRWKITRDSVVRFAAEHGLTELAERERPSDAGPDPEDGQRG